MTTYHSSSSEETKKLGRTLARKIRSRSNSKGATVFALRGDLGSGKTALSQGFLRGLGVKRRAPSPTFVLIRRTALRRKPFLNLYHVDAYRLKEARELTKLGFKEVLNDPKNIVLVEWADKVKRLIPRGATWLEFKHGRRENERRITAK